MRWETIGWRGARDAATRRIGSIPTKAQGSIERRRMATSRRRNGLSSGRKPRGRGTDRNGSWRHETSGPGQRRGGTTVGERGASVRSNPRRSDAVTTARLRERGTLRRVDAIGKGFALGSRPAVVFGSRRRAGSGRTPETWRTPWPVAGCNKPATCRTIRSLAIGSAAEKTVEVGRNDEDGTRSGVAARASGRASARTVPSGRGGTVLVEGIDEPQERSPRVSDRKAVCTRTARTGECL